MTEKTFKVSITLEVTAENEEEAAQFFVDDIKELGPKNLNPEVEELEGD